MKDFYAGKTILITGGAGSIGSTLVRRVLEYEPKTVRVLDSNETTLFNLGQELNRGYQVRLLVGDVRDKERMLRATEGVDIVFHAAGLKHVPLCERNPFEAVLTNVTGTRNLIEAALQAEVDCFITVSTDKAVSPINVMGASKLLAERLTVSANLYKGLRSTRLACVRFGNVLNSQGSVVPLFKEQIESGGPITLTDEDMTRFVMSIRNASDLVLKAGAAAEGGEIFILKMPALKIGDLAQAMVKLYGPADGKIAIETIGKREGEKQHEELFTEEEGLALTEDGEMFIFNSIKAGPTDSSAPARCRSDQVAHLSIEEIMEVLKDA